ncbi:DEAD/DEAH box helicase [Kitasatospora acidiphila]|uniref:DEAD/DEAH box helicase n=1 Tax=Kitasatospora acidiphila TaxID=2567942 RepID=A0A540VX38_9ACTN|nr:DEAD/DEAH box helicase family protein [Kitasatospora acidiphila]TQF01323.1 DEAD/DEAH box helicase [Kitasatospora acidiphila]
MSDEVGAAEYLTPEERARLEIDKQLRACGWEVQDHKAINLSAGLGVAVREFPLKKGYGRADYLLYVDRKVVGVLEAKREGQTLTGVEPQSGRYADGLPDSVPAVRRPLPFVYESTGIETRFTSLLDPKPRSREVHTFHRPEHLLELLRQNELFTRGEGPGTFRRGLGSMPPVNPKGLRLAQYEAIGQIEESLAQDKPRALVQMATGSGKTYAAASLSYRLLKFGGAKRILFLVDRGNLGRQTLSEFEAFATPDTGRLFTELYNVQHLTTNTVNPASNVVITTIQRLHSMLRDEPELDPKVEESSLEEEAPRQVAEFGYNAALPIEAFDVVIVDECHRSIYGVWRQALDYFDAHLIGLTATPSKQTYGFFKQNLVFSYTHERAVKDRVNVDFDVYRIRTRIGENGSTVEADGETVVTFKDRLTGRTRQAVLEDDLIYSASALDRSVVAPDQLRTVIRTFRERLFTEIFPGRTEVPKTLIFAKDDGHADRIVQMLREEFNEENRFAVKITYKTTGAKPEELLSDFRTSYWPRIAVTVDMIATGTDIKPLECVFFLREVKSRNFFEQMKGRGVRVINDVDFQQVTPDARTKTHFVIVDAVGVTTTALNETAPLDKTPKSVGLDKLLQRVAEGAATPDLASTIGSRLTRLAKTLSAPELAEVAESAGISLSTLAGALVASVDPDAALDAASKARAAAGQDGEPSEAEVIAARQARVEEALQPLMANPELRTVLARKRNTERTIDEVSQDELLEAGPVTDPSVRAQQTAQDFRAFLDTNRHEIEAIQALYEVPYKRRVTFSDIRKLATEIARPPHQWTPKQLWEAYEQLDRSKVRGSGGEARTDLVSLIRYALAQENELVPYRSTVDERLAGWLLTQQQAGRTFTKVQLEWLHRIADIIAASLEVTLDDLDEGESALHGGLGKAYGVFGNQLQPLLEELNQVLVA